MPQTIPPSDGWLAQQLAQLKRDVAALKAARTQYVVDPTSSTPEAIIGNLASDPSGNATGLSGWGVAVWNGTSWQALNGVRTGTVVFTFTASSASGSQVVTHGFGRSPFVFLQNASGGNGIASTVSAVTTTTFTANAFQTAGTSITTTAQFWWLAVG